MSLVRYPIGQQPGSRAPFPRSQLVTPPAAAATPVVFTPSPPARHPQWFFTLQRGRWTVVVPAQQNPPYPHRPRVSSTHRRAVAIRPRGQQWMPVQPQIPVPPTIPGNRQPAGRHWAFPVRGRKFVPTPAQDPVWPTRTESARSKIAALRRGKHVTPVPAQIPVPKPVWPNRVSALARRLFALEPRGKQVSPIPPQIPVPPTIPPKLGAPRKLLNVTARGRQWSAAAMAQPIVTLIWPPPRTAAARRLFAQLVRIRRTEVRPGQDVLQRPPRARDRLTALRRGRAATPTPSQVPVPPTIPGNRWESARSRIAALRRGRRNDPPWGITAAPPLIWPPPKLGAARRLLSGAQRGRRTTRVPPQTPVPPTIPGNRASSARSRFAMLRRGNRFTPTPPQTQPLPKLGAPRQLLSIATRGKRWFPTPAQIAVPRPVFPNRRPAGRRLAALFRGRRSGIPPQPITAITPKICYPTSALIVPYASAAGFVPHHSASQTVPYASGTVLIGEQSASTIVPYRSAVTHFNTCDD